MLLAPGQLLLSTSRTWIWFGGVGHLGQPEIQHLHRAVRPHFDVALPQGPGSDGSYGRLFANSRSMSAAQ